MTKTNKTPDESTTISESDSISPLTSKLKCGLIMPISASNDYTAEHWSEVRMIITDALKDVNFSVDLVSNSDEATVIQSSIVNNIYSSDIVVCDVSGKNPNVMFELGMRLAFNKCVVIIKDDITEYSFDTSIIEHLNYPSDLHYHSIVNFSAKLKQKVISTYEASLKNGYKTFLDNFGTFTVSTVAERELPPSEFILQSINEIKDSINKLNQRDNVTNNLFSSRSGNSVSSRYFSRDEADEIPRPPITKQLVENMTRKYCKQKNIPISDLKKSDVYEAVLIYIAGECVNRFSYSEMEALPIVHEHLRVISINQ